MSERDNSEQKKWAPVRRTGSGPASEHIPAQANEDALSQEKPVRSDTVRSTPHRLPISQEDYRRLKEMSRRSRTTATQAQQDPAVTGENEKD